MNNTAALLCWADQIVALFSLPRLVLQAQARNEADFRVPDQGGWQPKHQPIDQLQSLKHVLRSALPLQDIAGKLPFADLLCELTWASLYKQIDMYWRAAHRAAHS